MSRTIKALVKIIKYLMETQQDNTNEKVNESKNNDLIYKYSEKQTEHLDTFIVIPPDGGWGWIVVVAAFFSFLISDGVIYTFGIFLTDMSQTFNCSKSQVALTGAIMTGFFCLSGPFIAALVNRFGYRKIAVIGSLLASASCALTSISSSLYLTFLTHGVMGGLGFGFIYVPAIIAVGFYFERWRALATGIAVCGAGIGGITLPPILTLILNQAGWRQTFRVMSGLSLGCTLCGLLFRPIKPVRISSHIQQQENESEPKGTTENDKRSFFIRFHNTSHPTVADVYKSNTVSLDYINKIQPVIKSNVENSSTVTIYKDQKLATNVSSEFLMSIPSDFSTSSKGSTRSVKVDKPEISTKNIESKLSTVYEEKETNGCCKNIQETRFCRRIRNVCVHCKECLNRFPCNSCYHVKNKLTSEAIISRPLYRDDIFYSTSLLFLPEYRKSVIVSQSKGTNPSTELKSRSALEYSMLVTRTITQKELNEAKTCNLCTESIKRTLATMLDFSLLKSPSFILLASNAVFTSLGFYTPYMFIKDRAIQYDISEKMAFWLISCIGFTNTFGRIVCGIISSFSKVRAINISYTSLFVGGFATTLSGLSFNIWVQFGYAALYGLSVACMSALRTIIMVDMLGLERLTNAIGIILMFQGVASLAGTSISGFLRDLTGDYKMSFYFAGGCISAGSLLLIPIKKVSAWEKRRKEASCTTNTKTSDT